MRSMLKCAIVLVVVGLVLSLSVGDALAWKRYGYGKSYVKVYYPVRPAVACGYVGPPVYISRPVVPVLPCPPLLPPFPCPVPVVRGWACW